MPSSTHPPQATPRPGDAPEPWLALVRAEVPGLYRAVSRRVGADRALAEDIVQDTWLAALAAWRRRGVPADPGAWLRAVAFNTLRKHFRRAPFAALPGEPTRDKGQRDEDEAGERERRAALVQWGLARLPRANAELLAARHLDGRSLAELAAEGRTSPRAIEGRLRRARQALGRVLTRRGAGDALLDTRLDPTRPESEGLDDHPTQGARP